MESIKIVYSSADGAGRGIAQQLKSRFGFIEQKTLSAEGKQFTCWENGKGVQLIEVKERLSKECEYMARLPAIFESKLIIFASRHVSESGAQCFTAHATGNFTAKNEFGGNAIELGLTSAKASACLLRHLKGKQDAGQLGDYGVYREATHHGPTSLPWPSFFAELGSTEVNWQDEKAAGDLAEAIVFTAENWQKEEGTPAVGFGGTHYCSKFSTLEWMGKNCFSHIASKHVLDGIELQSVKQALEKTVEGKAGEVKVLLDWKGTNLRQREKLMRIFKEVGIDYRRV